MQRFKRIVLVAGDGVCWLNASCAVSLATSPILSSVTHGGSTSIIAVNRFDVPQTILSAAEHNAESGCVSPFFAACKSLCGDLPGGMDIMKRVAFAVDATQLNDGAVCFTPDVNNDLYIYVSAWSDADCCNNHMPLQSLGSCTKRSRGRLIIVSDASTRSSAWETALQYFPEWNVINCCVPSFAPPSLDLNLTRSFVRQSGTMKSILESVSLGVATGTVKHIPLGFREPLCVVPLDVALMTALTAVLLHSPDDKGLGVFFPAANNTVVLDVEFTAGDVLVWGMFLEYLLDYYGRLGPAALRDFPLPQLIDPKPTLQLSSSVSNWINYGVSLMMPFQCYYSHQAANRRKHILSSLPDLTTSGYISRLLDDVDEVIRSICKVQTPPPPPPGTTTTTIKTTATGKVTTIGVSSTSSAHSAATRDTIRQPPPDVPTPPPNMGYYRMMMEKLTQDPALKRFVPFVSLGNIPWDLYVKVIAKSVLELIARQLFDHQSFSLPSPLPFYHNDIVFHGKRRAPPTSLFPRKFFADIHWVTRCGMKPQGERIAVRPGLTKDSLADILASPSVTNVMDEVAKKENVSHDVVKRRAVSILRTVGDTLNQTQLRAFGLLVRRVLFGLFEEVSLNSSAYDRLFRVFNTPRAQVVLIPSHRSYVDFIIMTYLLVVMGFSPPHVCAGEDFLGMGPIAKLMRGSGAFFMRRSFRRDRLYYTLFREYVKQLVLRQQVLEFFIEGTRSRTNKTLFPKLGMLRFVTDTFLEGQDTLTDIYFVPISLSYDELMEAKLYADEQFGVAKPKENMENLFRARSLLNRLHGKIHVHVGEPFALRDLCDHPNQCPAPFEPLEEQTVVPPPSKNCITPPKVLLNLAWHITHRLQENTVITPTALLATVLNVFAQTEKGISLVDVYAHMTWLRSTVTERKVALSMDCINSDVKTLTSKGITHLGDFIDFSKEENMIKIRQDMSSFMGVTICSNQMVHVFMDEAVVSIAALMYGDVSAEKNVLHIDYQRLKAGCQQLRQLLSAGYQDYSSLCPYTFASWFDQALTQLLLHNDALLNHADRADDVQENKETTSPDKLQTPLLLTKTRLFNFLTATLSPVIESLFFVSLAVCAVVNSGTERVIRKPHLLGACQTCMLTLYDAKRVVHPQSCSQYCLTIALEGIATVCELKPDFTTKEPTYIIPTATEKDECGKLLVRVREIMKRVGGIDAVSPTIASDGEQQVVHGGGILKEYMRRLGEMKSVSKM